MVTLKQLQNLKPFPVGTSGYGLIDITVGKKQLAKLLADNPGLEIPVNMVGKIVAQHGTDDGTSIEFELRITQFKIPGGKKELAYTSPRSVVNYNR